MNQHGGLKPRPTEEGARRATEDGPGQGKKRFSARGKVEIVLRLLRGEDLELLSWELGVTAAFLSEVRSMEKRRMEWFLAERTPEKT